MINRFTLAEDLKRGEICLRANKSNTTDENMNEVITFLTEHSEVNTLHFFQSSINKAFAEKLAIIPTIKKINFFSHSHVLWDFYKNSDPTIVDAFQQKTGRDIVSINQKLNLFAPPFQLNINVNEVPEKKLTNSTFNQKH